MRASVRNNFIPFTTAFEGRLRYMYLDVKGLVTTGIGNLIDSVAAAQALPWQVGDGGPAATPDQVRAEWELVKSRQDLRNTPAERAFKPITTLRLSEAAVDSLVLAKNDSNEAVLKRHAAFASFDSWPADAQLGVLSMAWGLGAGFGPSWPNFSAAVAAGDWAAAATHCEISTTGNPGVVPRNAADRQLFNNAARVVAEGLDPDVLLYTAGGAVPQPPRVTGRAIFTVGAQCIAFDAGANATTGGAIPLSDHWKDLDGTGFEHGVRAVVALGTRRYAFSGNAYLRVQNQVVDPGYPLTITGYWPGFAEAGFDSDLQAAVDLGRGKVYFFRGDQYIRYDVAANAVDAGYPRPIAGNWPGMAEAGFGSDIDAAITWPNGKAYFFRGDSYVRYDIAADRVDAGYPQPIAGNWPGLAENGMAGPIDAVWLE